MIGRRDIKFCDEHVGPVMRYLGLCAFESCKTLEQVWIGRREQEGGNTVENRFGMVACDRAEDGGIMSVRWNPEAKLASPFFPPISDQP